jgi:hypothetical protein
MTVYEKGAEVVRLYNTLLGKEGFRKGKLRVVCVFCSQLRLFWQRAPTSHPKTPTKTSTTL